jgi:hypothetical protein
MSYNVDIRGEINLSDTIGHLLTQKQNDRLAMSDFNRFGYNMEATIDRTGEVKIVPIEAYDLCIALNTIRHQAVVEDAHVIMLAAKEIWIAAEAYAISSDAEEEVIRVANKERQLA